MLCGLRDSDKVHRGSPLLQKCDAVCQYREVDVAGIERLAITLPADMAGLVKRALDDGGYASTGEAIRDALRDRKLRRELRLGSSTS